MYDSKKENVRRRLKEASRALEEAEMALDETAAVLNDYTRKAVLEECLANAKKQAAELRWCVAQGENKWAREIAQYEGDIAVFERLLLSYQDKFLNVGG